MTTITIGIIVHAEPENLRATLAYLHAFTPRHARVVLLGDGPDAATAHALRTTYDGMPQTSTDIARGVPACFNRLVGTNQADAYVLLESGALVGPHWLETLLAALAADPAAGLAGPSTNRAWNEQALYPNAQGTHAEVRRDAARATHQFGLSARTLEPLYSLADFCYLVRRPVIEAIGAADEGFGTGPCWEMEYNARAARAGFRGLWVQGAWVWRSPFTARRARDEADYFDASRRRYQDALCGLRLRRERADYEAHCRGDACEHFAPAHLVRAHIPFTLPATTAGADEGESAGIAQEQPALPSPRITVESMPLVSCIMPTRGRPDFVRQAIACFARQEYAPRELIVVDEHGAPMPEIPAGLDVRVVQTSAGESIGAKRNRAITHARGDVIAQWDDDDWYAPERLRAQMAPLLAKRADICALRMGLVFDLPRWEFWRVTPDLHRRLFVADVHGGTLLFRKRVWEQGARYPDRSLAEDAAFLREALRRGARLEALAGDGLFLYLRHENNSWSFRCGHYLDPSGWMRAAEPSLPPADRAFYATRSPHAPELHAPTDPAPSGDAPSGDAPSGDAPSGDAPSGDAPSGDAPSGQAPAGHAHSAASAIASVDASAGATLPLVSCIMPTADRRAFVPQAIAHYRRQTYARRELIIVDDGRDGVADLVPAQADIRYVRLGRRHTVGAKRNLACAQARGEIIVHWDDDDWMAAWRLEYQVERLLATRADGNGLARLYFFDVERGQPWLYHYLPAAGKPWVAGATLCYRRAAWQRAPFPDVNVGEDARFVWGGALRTLDALPNADFYVALIHAGNTAPKERRPPWWSPWPGDLLALTQGELPQRTKERAGS